jgi:hypothetical protein
VIQPSHLHLAGRPAVRYQGDRAPAWRPFTSRLPGQRGPVVLSSAALGRRDAEQLDAVCSTSAPKAGATGW